MKKLEYAREKSFQQNYIFFIRHKHFLRMRKLAHYFLRQLHYFFSLATFVFTYENFDTLFFFHLIKLHHIYYLTYKLPLLSRK